MLPVALKTGPLLSMRYVPMCIDYVDYVPYVIGDWFIDSTSLQVVDITSCNKFQSYGLGKGAVYNPLLPGTMEGCERCLAIGFWSVFLGTILIPVVIYLIIATMFLCVSYCKKRMQPRSEYDVIIN